MAYVKRGCALALVWLLLVAPIQGLALSIGTAKDILTDATGADAAKNQVYFGHRTMHDAMLWRVMENSSGVVTLLATEYLDDFKFDDTSPDWATSELRGILNNRTAGSMSQMVLSPEEWDAMQVYALEPAANTKLVVPTLAEVENNGLWGMNKASRNYPYLWWTRTKDALDPLQLRIVEKTSSPDDFAISLPGRSSIGVVPALQIPYSSILMVSPASDVKQAAPVGPSLQAADATPPRGQAKLTVLVQNSATASLASASLSKTTADNGETLTVTYGGAATGADRFLSCLLLNASGDALFYGKLASTSSAGDGTATLTLPDSTSLPPGSYQCILFNEQLRGTNLTDFASAKALPLTIAAPLPPATPTPIPTHTGGAPTGHPGPSSRPAPKTTPHTGDSFPLEWIAALGGILLIGTLALIAKRRTPGR